MSRRRTRKNVKRTQPERCPICGRPFIQPSRGRRRRYCSNPCRQVAYRRNKHGAQQRRLVTLTEGDALQLLASLPDESVDLVVTDPPYKFDRGGTYWRKFFLVLPDTAWPGILAELERVLIPDSHCYVLCDRRTHPIFDAAAHQAGLRVHPPLVWDKGSIGLGGGTWRPQHELIAFYEKGSRPGNSRSLPDVIHAPRVVRGYPAEKPVALLAILIAQSSAPGELVLDPFCGSGNTGKAARQLGRRALLCDVDTTVARRRLRLAARALSPAAT
jgi:site-specific DNA-methyltransferase (adenine-specific)